MIRDQVSFREEGSTSGDDEMEYCRGLRGGSIVASFCRVNVGRFRRVDGTDNEMACGSRLAMYAEWGRMSRMRVSEERSACGSAFGKTAVKLSGETGADEVEAILEGPGMLPGLLKEGVDIGCGE